MNFNLIEHIRDLVSAEDNFLLDHLKVGQRVQIRLDKVIIPSGSVAGPVGDTYDVVDGRHLPATNKPQRKPPRLRAQTARGEPGVDQSGPQSSTVSALDLSKVVSKAVEHGIKTQPTIALFPGLIRYIGLVDTSKPSTTVYAGIKLDDRLGYTNGTFLGKRYFHAPEGHGVFIALCEISTVLNLKTYEYVPLGRMFRKWRKTQRK